MAAVIHLSSTTVCLVIAKSVSVVGSSSWVTLSAHGMQLQGHHENLRVIRVGTVSSVAVMPAVKA